MHACARALARTHTHTHTHTHTVPGVVVALVVAKSVAERGSGLVEVLVGNVLMARQRVGVGEGGVDLDSPVEKLDCCLKLALQREAVTKHAPCLWRQSVERHHLLVGVGGKEK
jgi:hypothetical protein